MTLRVRSEVLYSSPYWWIVSAAHCCSVTRWKTCFDIMRKEWTQTSLDTRRKIMAECGSWICNPSKYTVQVKQEAAPESQPVMWYHFKFVEYINSGVYQAKPIPDSTVGQISEHNFNPQSTKPESLTFKSNLTNLQFPHNDNPYFFLINCV